MDDAFIKQIQETIKVTVTSVVNGKIDSMREDLNKHNKSHEADMQRILPVVEAYESAQNGGRLALKIGGVFTILGTAWITAKTIWPSL